MTALKTLDSNQPALYVLSLDESLTDGGTSAFAVPVMTRTQGVILAVPGSFLLESVLDQGQMAGQDELIGPSIRCQIPGVEEDEQGDEVPCDSELDLLLVDFNIAVESSLLEFDAASHDPPSHAFSSDKPAALPASNLLWAAVCDWIGGPSSLERINFYSAGEEELVPETPARGMTPPPKRTKGPATAAKRVTTAQLADQLATITQAMQVIPSISSQLQVLQDQQAKFENVLRGSTAAPKMPPHRQPFPKVGNFEEDSAANFMAKVGSAPRVRSALQTPVKPGQNPQAEEEPAALPSEEGFLNQIAPPLEGQSIGQAMVQQSQALTSLVAHMIGQEGVSDWGGSGAAGSLSTRGSMKREKLLDDLAHRNGHFFLQVAQNAHRRLKPGEVVPKDLGSFGAKPLFSKYLERQGGFNGQKNLGLVMWMLCQIADQALVNDFKGVQELLALMMVSLEQCAQDNGRWDLAWVLSLQEDPPTGVFNARPAQTNPRLRAFAPLCPAPWTTTALSYVKELDLISSRRADVVSAGPSKPNQQKTEDENAAPKRKPRYPKRPKAGGGGGETS